MKHNFNFDCPYYYKDILTFEQSECGQTYSQTIAHILNAFMTALEYEPIVRTGHHRVHVGLSQEHLDFLVETAKAFGMTKNSTLLLAFEHYRNFKTVQSHINYELSLYARNGGTL